MKSAALVLCCTLVAGPALSQTTQCSDFMGTTTCETSGPAKPVSWRDVPPKACSRIERIANSSNLVCEARDVASSRKAVGDLIAEGRCSEALKAALGTGDLQFAGEVRAFCSPPQSPPSQP